MEISDYAKTYPKLPFYSVFDRDRLHHISHISQGSNYG
ncbi:hypothetical protein APA_1206 [Pseudanabaena sp. lw0831]|nr:hypothetical protein APA_1206 [Pseudanabaena sp. lw0831]